MEPVFFKNQNEFRKWLEKNHQTKSEIIVGYYKVATGKPSLTWSQSVDQAICFGWIDGIRRSIDEESYCIRFTPRRPGSNWSKVNIKKVEELRAKGLMKEQGLDSYNNRQESKSGIYSFEKEDAKLPDKLVRSFKENDAAWTYFSNQAPSYRKNVIHWVMSAKQEATMFVRFNKLLDACEKQRKIY